MMDAHVHIMAQPSTFIGNAMRRGPPLNKSGLAMHGVLYAQRTLAAGFTVVRDVGSNDESVFALRNAINRGHIPGPTMVAAGPVISATGGHGDRSFGATKTLDPDVRLENAVCDGPAECVRVVRHLKQLGADLIKFMTTGGFSSNTGLEQHMSPMDALRSATIVTAALFGIENAKGTIEAGKIADLIAIDGDPLVDIKAMLDIDGVIKSGSLVKQDAQLLPLLELDLPQRY